MKRIVGSKAGVLLGIATWGLVLGSGGCISPMGGCYIETSAVVAEPKQECLVLYQGNGPDDHLACGAPSLGGRNDCSEPLTLPPQLGASMPTVVAPGGEVFWRFPDMSVAPGVTVARTGDDSSRAYTILATLGGQPLTIKLTTRHSD